MQGSDPAIASKRVADFGCLVQLSAIRSLESSRCSLCTCLLPWLCPVNLLSRLKAESWSLLGPRRALTPRLPEKEEGYAYRLVQLSQSCLCMYTLQKPCASTLPTLSGFFVAAEFRWRLPAFSPDTSVARACLCGLLRHASGA